MKYKRFVYTPVLLIITTIRFSSGSDGPNHIRGLLEKYNHASKLERIVAMWNRSSEFSHRNAPPGHAKAEETFRGPEAPPSFPSEVSRCIEAHQFQITEDFSRGKGIILNCFKTSLMLTVLGRYLGESPKSSIKLFNGLLEFEKIPENVCGDENCDRSSRNFGSNRNKNEEYIRMYKKAMQKLIDQRKKFNSHRNLTESEKQEQLNRIDANSQAFLSEVIRGLGNEDVERMEEEKLKKEILDPRLLSMLDALSKSYVLRLRFYPGVSARMMRSTNGGFTFDLEIPEADEVVEEETSSDESMTREIKDASEPEDYSEENESTSRSKKRGPRGKGGKKKRKELKKKAKKLKKVLPYLLLPMIIQMSLLPFVLKKLFFFAMKALLAGKVALILVAINLLKNNCDHKDYNQKIRVEHYGYKKGEEYGAWVNGRSMAELPEPAMSEEPFGAHRPASE